MSLILSLETSTHVCSVALHDAGKLVATREVHIPQSHAARLAPMIEEVRREAGIELKQLAAVAVASGPGSYTGLRIGVSTAKALCYTLQIPLIAVGTLDVMALQVAPLQSADVLLCPMIDARRMEVYCQVTTPAWEIVQPVEAKIIDEGSFADLLERQRVVFFGDGAAKCSAVISHPNAIFVDNIAPLASALGVLAHAKFLEHRVEDLVHFEPFYLKDFLIKKPAADAAR
jgi:tRNA threonylcarbamoyladenosine biosynthesis protein TsaB